MPRCHRRTRTLPTIYIVLGSLLLLGSTPAAACTSFLLPWGKQVLFGKSYDWDTGHGLLLVNKRGVAKQALLLPGTKARPARWTSLHGNVTFNQYGRDLPLGGMNERGLVVEVMWLSATQHGSLKKGLPALNELQWIQYLLDTAGSVDEAISQARKVQVAKAHGAVHYLACERSGACAAFEYLGGKLVVHRGKKLPVNVLANDTYARSLDYLRQHKGFGGPRDIPTTLSSRDRFVRAAALVRRSARRRGSAVARAAQILDSVYTKGWTRWQIVYEPHAGRIHFRAGGKKKFYTINARAQDYSCVTAVQVVDLLGSITGKRLARPVDYRYEHNHKLLKINLKALKAQLPPALLKLAAAYPQMATRCTSKGKNKNKSAKGKRGK